MVPRAANNDDGDFEWTSDLTTRAVASGNVLPRAPVGFPISESTTSFAATKYFRVAARTYSRREREALTCTSLVGGQTSRPVHQHILARAPRPNII